MYSKAQDDDLVMNLVDLALSRPPAERESFLSGACTDDVELYDQVLKYVRDEENMHGFMVKPLFSMSQQERHFEPGQLLVGRFRIVREVAQGGMGVVYESWDQRLDKRVALKCAKPGFRRRLPPEVRHATEIAHPNVCKIFEIHTAMLDGEETDFLTMEFLEGQTLASRLAQGPLPQPEARAIAIELCQGLAEAHRKGVIHGDLKANNIILAKAANGMVRAVITDFGLARGMASSLPTMPSEAGGTPDYMAPELWRGGKATPASDIYALGVVLYELACGRRPFSQEISLEQRALLRVPHAHPKWDRVLARCLASDPQRRFTNADEIARALAPRPIGRWLLAAAAATLLASLTGVVTYRAATAPAESLSLAVLPFSADAKTAALAEGLLSETGEQLRHLKGGRKRLTLIPVRDAIQNRVDQPAKARSTLGAMYALHGTLRRDGGRLLVNAILTDARSVIQVNQWMAEYPVNQIKDVPVALAGFVTATMHLPAVARAATVNAAAYQDYVTGTALARRDLAPYEGIALLERAVTADDKSPLTHARLAEAFISKFRFTRDPQWSDRAATALRAAELRNPDVAEVRFVSGFLEESLGQIESAETDYLRAIELDPQNVDAYRRLGKVYEGRNRPAQALAAYGKAMELQPEYWRNYQDVGTFHFYRAEYDEAIKYYKKTVDVAPDMAGSHYALALPYLNLGRYFDAEKELQLSQRFGEFHGTIHGMGLSYMYQGRDSEAIPLFRRAIKIGPPNALYYLNLGTALRRTGQAKEAHEAYRKAQDLAESVVAGNPLDAMERSNLAYIYARLGQTDRALFEATQAMRNADRNMNIRWMVVLTYEALGRHELTLPLLQDMPWAMLDRLDRFPDLADLRRNSRFKQLLELNRNR